MQGREKSTLASEFREGFLKNNLAIIVLYVAFIHILIKPLIKQRGILL